MSFELKRSESPGKGLSRIAAKEVDAILKMLNRRRGDQAEAVHEIRKSIKKIRALIRLLRGALGEKTYRFENTFFRDAGHQLSDARDAQILIETLEKLGKMERAPRHLLTSLEKQFTTQRDSIHTMLKANGVLRRLNEILGASNKRIKGWPDADWDDISSELRRSYKRGRDAFSTAIDSPTFENHHEWRKRVKDLLYQARLLHPIWPDVMQHFSDQSHTLSEKLGDDHDFGVLKNVLKQQAPQRDGVEHKRLLDLIEDQHRPLRREAKEIGEQLYHDKPKDFAARLKALRAAP